MQAKQPREKRIARIYLRELFGAIALYAVLLAAAITTGLTFTYGFLEGAGFPRLSMLTVWCVLCGTFGLVQLGRKLLSR